MDTFKRVAVAVATVVCAVCMSVAPITGGGKYNVLTITEVNFDIMLGDPHYEQWFRDNLRCDQTTFGRLVVWLRCQMPQQFLRRSVHSFEKKVAVFLFFLGSERGYRETAAAFGMAKSCIPTSSSEWHRIERGFFKCQKLPGVVGAIDGTLIDIQRPREYDGFYNRNGNPSLNVQAMVDHKMVFLSVDIRPGSFSDKQIWKKRFNYRLSSTRMVVECAFGRLKERFRILKTVMNEKSLDHTRWFVFCTVSPT
ncbi:hypothetical protein H257_19256 [Aphanomyces astaci]|uniref:DDE Tnp4 domain-containing protein n=1 Tax=Aphanomyces astaci TaxID=112090 RepID=W4FA58_APHAT|nr:hypothetical protein H257_19256 [Aphanomyces astaci]ETV63809.1 hypothetical protein H257_19256 [Aphanomyces astaci]|eukprot:XP_009846705.1 hypothetical protein H257_19256 [Aphanomyces astaci]